MTDPLKYEMQPRYQGHLVDSRAVVVIMRLKQHREAGYYNLRENAVKFWKIVKSWKKERN